MNSPAKNAEQVADMSQSQSQHALNFSRPAQVQQTPHGFLQTTNHQKSFSLAKPAHPSGQITVRRPPPHVRLSQDIHTSMRPELLASFPHRDTQRSKSVTLIALMEYVHAQGLQRQQRLTVLDVLCFTKGPEHKGTAGKQDSLPIVILSHTNSVGCNHMMPGQHGCVYSPSTVFRQVVTLPAFHLMVRAGAGQGNRLEQARYYGVYTASFTEFPLPADAWRTLSNQERLDILKFENRADLSITRDEVNAAYEAGNRQLSGIVLENLQFDRKFLDMLIAKEGTITFPVAAPKCLQRPQVDWKKMREDWNELDEEGLF